MPAQRLAMRQVYEVLRLKWEQGFSDRKIAHSLGISRPTVAEYVRRAQAAGLSWPLPAPYDEETLERLLFPAVSARTPALHLVPDWAVLCQKGLPLRHERFAVGPARDCEQWSGSAPQGVTKGPHTTIPTPSYGLSSPKNAPLPQRFAGLPERCAARRAFGTQKAQKRFEISPNFSRQGYASDFRSRHTFLTTSASLAGEVRHMKQRLPCCVALVLLRVKSTHLQCPISPKKRQNYESIAANLSDESHGRRSTTNSNARASPCSCCGRNIRRPRPMACSTAGFVTRIEPGHRHWIWSCASPTARGRSSLSITPGRAFRWSTGTVARCMKWRFSWRSWVPQTTPMPRRPGLRVCPTGSAPMSGPLRRSVVSPRSSSPITSKRP